MAPTVVERKSRVSAPETVEDDLAAIWREIAGNVPVARAVMSNVIVFRVPRKPDEPAAPDRTADRLNDDRTIDAVIARHPSRTIVLELDEAHVASVGAIVSVGVFGSPAAPYGAETILIRSACADVSLPFIVRRFVRGDVPTSVWWTEDLSRLAPPAALLVMSRQLVFDSRCWSSVAEGCRALADAVNGPIDLADLNWRRLDPFRRALAHASPSIPSRLEPDRVRITHRPADAAMAWLLAGWLASRLGWARDRWPAIHESTEGDAWLSLSVEIGSTRLGVTMNERRVVVDAGGMAPMSVAVPQLDEAQVIAAELRSLARDAHLHESLSAIIARVLQS